jgi:hypothetical protein
VAHKTIERVSAANERGKLLPGWLRCQSLQHLGMAPGRRPSLNACRSPDEMLKWSRATSSRT